MDKRELYKVFDFGDRHWRIGKFDARTGSYIAYKLMGEMLPMGIKIDGVKAPEGSPTMSKADFFDLQNDCLKICAELLQAGPAPVMNENGSWGVEGIENDAKLALTLTIHALTWNIADFFDASLLQGLAAGFTNLIPPTAKM